MHSSQCPTQFVEGHIALDQLRIETMGGKLVDTPTPGEKPSFILMPLKIDNKSALQFRFVENHDKTLTSGIGIKNFPPHSLMKAICCMTSSRIFHGRMST